MFDIQQEPELERLTASGTLQVINRSGHSQISKLRTSGGYQVRQQHRARHRNLHLSLINTAGGLTGGDQLNLSIDIQPKAGCLLSTPAAEKAYRSSGKFAQVGAKVTIGTDAHCAWLPQETILYQKSDLSRSLVFHMYSQSSLLMCETVVLGRHAHGETLTTFNLHDRWRIYYNDQLVHREDNILDLARRQALTDTSALAGKISMTTLVYIGCDAEDQLHQIRSFCQPDNDHVSAGCSAWKTCGTTKLIARFLTTDFYHVKPRLTSIIGCLNDGQVPKSWAI